MAAPLRSIDARRWEGLTPAITGGRFHLTATCTEPGCTAEQVWSTRTVFDPAAAVARARKAGWRTGKVKCPDHARSAKPKKEPEIVSKPAAVLSVRPTVVSPTSVPPVAANGEPSDAARLAKRLVIAALEDHYDDVAKRYRPGHTDASIAKEAGCAEAVVAKLREDLFGPLGEPDEIAELRGKLDMLRGRVREIKERAAADIQQANDALGEVAAQIDRLATANGWRR